MQAHHISFADTGRFSKLAVDHAVGDGFLDGFRQFPPTLAGLHDAAAQRGFSQEHRAVLARVLRRQYEGLDALEAVSRNIDRLADDGLAVTTGHQLCLFMGPMYVPFKLLNAIRLAEQLSTETGRPVVPVFWMASEDHDRAEVDHAFLRGQQLDWPGEAGGAVGRMTVDGSEAAVEKAIAGLGAGPHGDELGRLLRDAYRPGRTKAEAMRRLVHGLFGRLGLVIIDGDDPELKRLFVPVMREEMLNGIVQRTVSYADERLKERYAPQAHARPINLFHLRRGHRSRIEHHEDGFRVLDGGPRFSMDELLLDLELRPQDYSPNVLMRPLYQESVLPNIAYIGGGGELAYWMQLRWLFQAVQVPMPAVLLRASAAFLPGKLEGRRAQLGLSIEDLFLPEHTIMNMVARTASGVDINLDQERASMEALISGIATRASAVDATLEASAGAMAARAHRLMDGMEERMARALRRQQAVALGRAHSILEALFPAGQLQERRESLLPLIAERGPEVLDELLQVLDPLDPRFTVLIED